MTVRTSICTGVANPLMPMTIGSMILRRQSPWDSWPLWSAPSASCPAPSGGGNRPAGADVREWGADAAPDGRTAGSGQDHSRLRAGAGRHSIAADTGRVDGAAVRAVRRRWEARRAGRPAHLGGPPGVTRGHVRDPRLRLLVQ